MPATASGFHSPPHIALRSPSPVRILVHTFPACSDLTVKHFGATTRSNLQGKTILWSSERSTLADGINFAGHKPLLDLLNSDENYVNALPAIPLPDGELDLSISDSIDPISFDRMSALPASGEPSNSTFTGNESSDMDLITFNNTFQPPQVELQDAEMSMEIGPLQTTALSAPPVKPAQYQLLLPGAALSTAESKSSKSGDRCALHMQHKARIRVRSMLQLWDRRAVSVAAG
ncbi:hypothetical protein C8R44DRAFT_745105 [Mycena epipterygia]|nr:hypothetical protein C8R44DRAFT_745105 [Mycena epipterygia]